uniref:Acyltransferase n=1 Tax=Ascaris lumbricoides TaxID=6252 RepID=A0A0M3IAG0_ASCLU
MWRHSICVRLIPEFAGWREVWYGVYHMVYIMATEFRLWPFICVRLIPEFAGWREVWYGVYHMVYIMATEFRLWPL